MVSCGDVWRFGSVWSAWVGGGALLLGLVVVLSSSLFGVVAPSASSFLCVLFVFVLVVLVSIC